MGGLFESNEGLVCPTQVSFLTVSDFKGLGAKEGGIANLPDYPKIGVHADLFRLQKTTTQRIGCGALRLARQTTEAVQEVPAV